VYTEPRSYGKNGEDNQFVFTQGLDRIEPIPGFTGSSKKSKDALIVILGFEGNKANEVFEEVNPDITYAINGFPSFQSGWHQISFENNIRFLKDSQAYKNFVFSPSIDPFETKKQLIQTVNKINADSSDYNIVISPLGTKMQALGVLLFAINNREIKVVYPFPSYYVPEYSKDCGPSWICNVNLTIEPVENICNPLKKVIAICKNDHNPIRESMHTRKISRAKKTNKTTVIARRLSSSKKSNPPIRKLIGKSRTTRNRTLLKKT
jgi:hypothetical protein